MTYEALAALAAFAIVTSITPGPNNLMLMASGANFGLRRSLPHMLGIGIGFTVMILGVGLGLAGLFEAYPQARKLLMVAATGYLLWLAWKLAHAAAPGEGHGDGAAGGRPLSFLQAAGFQWVNGKAWAMALTAVTVHAPDRSLGSILVVALVFGAINLPSVSTWVLAGQGVRRLLQSRARLRAFNWAMAALLLVSSLPMVLTG
jgi:threonine/homoserine/homoserine lactone efflux protein